MQSGLEQYNVTVALFIYNASAKESASRGVGRYTNLLTSLLHIPTITTSVHTTNQDIIIDPFLNLVGPLNTMCFSIRGKKIGVIHDIIPMKYPSSFPLGIRGNVKMFINQKIARMYNVIITDSESSKKDISAYLNIDPVKIHVIYPPTPQMPVLEPTDKIKDLISAEPYLLYVGDVNWNKNISYIAEICIRSKIKLVCVGRSFVNRSPSNHPWLDELRLFVQQTKDSPYIICTGFLSDSDLGALYKHAAFNILLSRDEGFGFSYVEAAAQGTPSLLSNIPIFHEIADSQGCIYIPLDDLPHAIKLVRTALSDKSQRDILGKNAQLRSEKFSTEQFVMKWNTILQSLSPQ
jgi:glycosyltransferase involved in cell wall biosynthesis